LRQVLYHGESTSSPPDNSGPPDETGSSSLLSKGASPPFIRMDTEAEALDKANDARRVAELAEAKSIQAWTQALEAERALATLMDSGASREEIAELTCRVEALRAESGALSDQAESARHAANLAEDHADLLQQQRLKVEAERISTVVHKQEFEEAKKLAELKREQSAERRLRRDQEEEAARQAAAKAAAQKEAAVRRAARRRKEAAVAAQSKVVDERADVARKTLKLDFSGLGICDIPSYVYSDPLLRHIRILWLNQNEFESLPPEISRLQDLTQLRVFQNKLRYLPPEIGDLGKLQILWLQDNLLDTLPPEIEKLTSLTLLSLKGNPLKVLPVELSRLKRIREMELDTDCLTFPPSAISRAGTQQVQDFLRRADRAWVNNKLDLSDMNLDCLPLDIIELFPRIDRLWITGNPISCIPFEFSAMTQLTDLRFDSNTMRSPSMKIWGLGLPRSFVFMRKFLSYRTIPHVDLNGWGLDEIPNEVFESDLAPRVTILDFADNNLKMVPDTISCLHNLVQLKLDNNSINSMPASICLLSALTVLSAKNNLLTSFPDCMSTMVDLSELWLDSNVISNIPSTILHLKKLRKLSLPSNRIALLPPELPKVTSLKFLFLDDNLIQRLPLEYGVFTSLTKLDLGTHQIWSPPADILKQALGVWFSYLDSLFLPLKTKGAFGNGRANGQTNPGKMKLCRFGLSEFPPEISRFPLQFLSLTDINMDENRLSTLPREVGKLTNLTVLSLAKNLFRACPSILGKLFNLTDINLERNLLTYLPMEIGSLTALKTLHVHGNRLSHPPMEIVKLGVSSILRFLKVFAQGTISGEVAMPGCNLKAVPMAVLDIEQLTRLDLSHNSIGRIPGEFLNNQIVTHLDLSYNVISELEPQISGLVNLTTLILSGNRIEVMIDPIFTLSRLEVLIMNRNLLDDIPREIGVMTWLKELKLSNNRLEDLPMEIGRLISLQRLNLAYNMISSVPVTIGNLTALRDLSLVGNELQFLPPIMGVMTGLRQMHFVDNDLERHPSDIVQAAKQLQLKSRTWHSGMAPTSPLSLWLARIRAARITKALDASNFALTEVPEEVLNLTSLQLLLLNLQRNEIKCLAPSIAGLSTLTQLDLSHNRLKEIPRIIGTMSNLTVLYLNDNKLARLPIEMGHLPGTNLKRLTINNNRLETPPQELMTLSTANILLYYATSEIAILTGELDWSWCKALLSMRSICLEVPNWERLMILHLDNNEISSIDTDICLAMEKLEVLELRRNRLTTMPESLCAHSRLRVLALSSNRISKLPISLYSMRSLIELEIFGMNIVFPSKEITRYGTENILAYLQSIHQAYTAHICALNFFDLSEIPPEVLDMKYVEIIELDHMRISSLPPVLVDLLVLERLSFNYNSVSELPIFLADLSNLTELEFEGNRIERLFPEHCQLTKLRHLNLNKNPIKTPPQEVLHTLEVNAHGHRHSSPQTDSHPSTQVDHLEQRPGAHFAYNPIVMNPSTVLKFLRALFIARQIAVLDLGNFKLSLWPTEVQETTHVVELLLDNNNIRFIGQDVQNLNKLTHFSISHNKLKSIVPNLGQITSLVFLNVSSNQIEELSSAIGTLVNLETLLATDNMITLLPIFLFQCTSLKSLHLDRNKITELPPEFGTLSMLQDLTYEGNPVIIPPEEIRHQGLTGLLRFYNQIIVAAPACNLKGMECEIGGVSLDLSNFELAYLPELVYRGMPRPGGSWDDPPNRFRRDRWAFGMTHLKSLILDRNRISELPEMISRCAALETLSAAHNIIKFLPVAFTSLKSLQLLDLHCNSLERLPDSMSRLDDLRDLILDDNKITALPDGLGNLTDLQTLQVNKNLLANLPVDLCETKTLRVLGVNENPLRMPPHDIVSKGLRHIMDWLGRLLRCSQTQTLDLRGLGLSSVDYNILPIANVRRILLASNKLISMSSPNVPVANTHCGHNIASTENIGNENLKHLEYLNADNNYLTQVPDSIKTLTSLTELSLKNNKISELLPGLATLTNLKKLYLSNNALTSLPMELALLRTTLRKLDLEGNALLMPPRYICASGVHAIMKYLEDLLLSKTSLFLEVVGAKLEGIPSEVLDLTHLERLLLDENEINEIPLRLCDIKQLVHLSLSRNRISAIPREVCESLLELQLLHLDNNEITVLPTQIGKLTKLEELWLQINSILILPLEVGNLTRLRSLTLDVSEMVSPTPEVCAHGTRAIIYYLRSIGVGQLTGAVDLRSQGLTAFPIEIFAISSLTALHLDDNHLVSLPPSLERLTDLTELTLTRLRLTSLPYVLGACTGLTNLRIDASRRFRNPPYEVVMKGTAAVLDYLRRMYRCARDSGYINLSSLGLEVLPTELVGLQNLVHLQCRDNGLQHLPADIGGMHLVEIIHMHSNRLVALPAEIGRLGALTVLRLPSNRLCTLPVELGACHSLRKLSLQDNLLVTTPPDVLAGLSDLECLNLGRNQLVFIPDTVGDMLGLIKLRADQNQLRSLPSALGLCTRLTLLSLTCNLLATLPDTMANCTALTALHISSNRFRLLPRCVDALVGLRWLWAANNELIGLPTSLAGLPHLYELQVNGCADLRYPPPEVVVEGLDAVRAYLLCNMQYEDSDSRSDTAAEAAAVAEAKALGDVEAAELAAAVIKPLRRLAEELADSAQLALREAAELRFAAGALRAKNLTAGAAGGDGIEEGLTASELRRAAAMELAASQLEEAEENALVAETKAARLKAEAMAAAARASEAVEVFAALSAIAAESEQEAEALRTRPGSRAVGKSVELLQ
jgi:Leucine-rich repeat (LRR) protein